MAKKRIVDYDLWLLRRRRTRLMDILSHHFNQQFDNELFEGTLKAFSRTLKLGSEHEIALRSTLFEFIGLELTDLVCTRIAIKLAGGVPLLKRLQPVPPFSGLPAPEWAPVELAEIRYGRIVRGRLWLLLRALVLGGTAVGQEIVQFLPYRFVVYLLAKQLGWPKDSYRPAHTELVRMIMLAELASDDRKTEMVHFDVKGQQLKYNRQVREARLLPCVRSYMQQCRSCPIGYSACMRGTHRYTWLVKACPACGNERANFDPEDPGAKRCLACRAKPMTALVAAEQRFV